MKARIGVLVVAVLLTACADDKESTNSESTAATTVLAGNEGRLLFSRFTEATHTFDATFIANPDGSDETEIPMPGPEGGGRWSHAGTEIAVMTVLDDGRIGTAIISDDGTVLRVFDIPDPTLNLVCTVWSPDDSHLACDGWDDNDPASRGIYIVNSADGSGSERLTTSPAGTADEAGDFSPNGQQIVFKRFPGDEGPGPLLLVDVAGGEPTTLTDIAMENSGRFAPDGLSVLSASSGHIVVIDLSGNEVYKIIESGAYLFGPDWSPDGTRIVYSRSVGAPFADIYTSNPDGTDRVQVTTTQDNEITIDWGADPS